MEDTQQELSEHTDSVRKSAAQVRDTIAALEQHRQRQRSKRAFIFVLTLIGVITATISFSQAISRERQRAEWTRERVATEEARLTAAETLWAECQYTQQNVDMVDLHRTTEDYYGRDINLIVGTIVNPSNLPAFFTVLAQGGIEPGLANHFNNADVEAGQNVVMRLTTWDGGTSLYDVREVCVIVKPSYWDCADLIEARTGKDWSEYTREFCRPIQ